MRRWIPIIITIFWGFSASAQHVRVKFKLDASKLKETKSLGIRGNIAPLTWERTLTIQDTDHDGIFEGEVTFENTKERIVEYKFVYGDKKLVYELEGPNRILLLDREEIVKQLTWDVPEALDMRMLPLVSSEGLLEDFGIFKAAMLEIHPGLYRYRSPSQIDSLFQQYSTVFSQPMTYSEAFLNFTRLTSFIQCGHTFPSFFNQPGFIQQLVLDQPDKLPFTFRVIDRRMFIVENASEPMDFPCGTEVLSIDGRHASVFIKEVANLVKADGSNDNKRFADLNTFGIGGYEMFDAYFPLLYPPKDGSYTLEIQRPNTAQIETVNLKTVTRKERLERLKQRNPQFPATTSELWKLEFWDNKTAYLQLGTFDGFQLSFEWKAFLKDAFDQIRKNNCKNLVIDIRWNEGGQDDILLYLGQNIAKSKLILPQRLDLIRYTKISDKLRPYLSTWENSFFDLTGRVKPVDSQYNTFTETDVLEITPVSNAFQGNIYLLINAANSSATFYFAEIAKENKLATLVGETTGGNQQGLNAGTMFFLRLPNTKIEIDIPIIGTFSKDKAFGGIMPDVEVQESANDLFIRKDPVIEKTKQLIGTQ